MPGPAPKDPSIRSRRNVASTKAKLAADPTIECPPLPEWRPWHSMTAMWWSDLWGSPMAPEFDQSDLAGLFALAILTDDFWMAEDAGARMKLAAELRQQGQRFGLSPIDRRRLQWEIERTEEARDKGERRRTAQTRSAPIGGDPRATLRAL